MISKQNLKIKIYKFRKFKLQKNILTVKPRKKQSRRINVERISRFKVVCLGVKNKKNKLKCKGEEAR